MAKKKMKKAETAENKPKKKMSRKAFEKELEKLQVELCRLQAWVVQSPSV
jgi:polyphosphate kinase 2 (PPK2 family)